ncbi:MAG: phosphatidylcholine/phosphatidylserine synthase [Planctomycetes bacterium]|nr:phosphatidylcholine/phosphatidylserine synthase [Planctomycetota bacterium]
MNDRPEPSARVSVRQRIRRLKTLPVLPTLLTAGNLACGITAILCAAHAEGETRMTWLYAGAIMVFVAMVCDMLDGKVARLTHTEGAFGAELDSLSDVVSFGVAPAILVHRLILGEPGVFDYGQRLLWFVTVFYPVMASIRLARYNVEHSEEATPYFRGLPSPGAAAVVCAWIIFCHSRHDQLVHWGLLRTGQYSGLMNMDIFSWATIAVAVIAALLMVSTVRYPHVGNTMLGRISFRKMIVGLLVVAFLVAYPADTLFVATTTYVLWGLVMGTIDSFRLWRRGGHLLVDEDEEAAEDAGLHADKDPDTGPAPGR